MTVNDYPHRCLFCDGQGKLHGYQAEPGGPRPVSWPCRHCDGTGIVYVKSDRKPEEQVHADT